MPKKFACVTPEGPWFRLDHIWRVPLNDLVGEVVRIDSHYYRVWPASQFTEFVAEVGAENLLLSERDFPDEFVPMPFVKFYGDNLGMYSEAFWR